MTQGRDGTWETKSKSGWQEATNAAGSPLDTRLPLFPTLALAWQTPGTCPETGFEQRLSWS